MAVLFYVVLLLAVLLALFLVALLHAGFFYELRIRTSTPLSCPKRVAYKLHTGPYRNCGAHFRRLATLVPSLKTFGVYYDDPDKVINTLYGLQVVNSFSTLVFSKCSPSSHVFTHYFLLGASGQASLYCRLLS